MNSKILEMELPLRNLASLVQRRPLKHWEGSYWIRQTHADAKEFLGNEGVRLWAGNLGINSLPGDNVSAADERSAQEGSGPEEVFVG